MKQFILNSWFIAANPQHRKPVENLIPFLCFHTVLWESRCIVNICWVMNNRIRVGDRTIKRTNLRLQAYSFLKILCFLPTYFVWLEVSFNLARKQHLRGCVFLCFILSLERELDNSVPVLTFTISKARKEPVSETSWQWLGLFHISEMNEWMLIEIQQYLWSTYYYVACNVLGIGDTR